MARRPSFQFYPADWRSSVNLRRCSPAARGAWMDILAALHDSDEYGVARWPMKELAQAAGVALSLANELAKKGVLKGSDTRLETSYVYTPRSGRKDGPPITLIPAQDGPIWYSSRLVRDEYNRQNRGKSTRFGAAFGDAPKATPTRRVGDRQGDGSSSSSSSTSTVEEVSDDDNARARPPPKTKNDVEALENPTDKNLVNTDPRLRSQPRSASAGLSERSKTLLARICEILSLDLISDPDRLTWGRQVLEMLRDGLDEKRIIEATEIARTHGKLNMQYIRACAFSPPKGKSDGRNFSAERATRVDNAFQGARRFISEDDGSAGENTEGEAQRDAESSGGAI